MGGIFEKKVSQFTDRELNEYPVYIKTEYVLRYFGAVRALSPKSLRNIWITLCSSLTSANTEFRMEDPINVLSFLFEPKYGSQCI